MADTSKDKGRLPLWRKFEEDWKWDRPLHRSAWVWMLMKAAYVPHDGLERGQLYFSLRWAPEVWGMDRQTALEFLERCVLSGDILWHKSKGGRPKLSAKDDKLTVSLTVSPTVSLTVPLTVLSVITICNYGKYNPSSKRELTVFLTDKLTVSPQVFNCHSESSYTRKESIIKKVKKPASEKSDHQKLINFFTDQYEFIHDTKYVFQAGRDGKAVQNLMKSQLPFEEIQERMLRFLEDDDPFVFKQGHSLSFFVSRINSYRKNGKPKKTDDDWKRRFVEKDD